MDFKSTLVNHFQMSNLSAKAREGQPLIVKFSYNPDSVMKINQRLFQSATIQDECR